MAWKITIHSLVGKQEYFIDSVFGTRDFYKTVFFLVKNGADYIEFLDF